MADIYKLTAYDLMCTKITNGNYYVTTDTKQVYSDANGIRNLLSVSMIATENQRINNVLPSIGTYYYVWETNTLWTYNAKWIIIAGNYSYVPSGYYYVGNEITPTDEEVTDNNGLLKDGSVVVRNADRIIKGKLYIQNDERSSNLIISSYLGGGIKLLPSGSIDSTGALEIFSANTYTGEFDGNGNPVITGNSGELVFYGDMYVTDGTNRFKILTSKDGYTYEAGEGIILGDTPIYILLLEEPDDWSTEYNTYYKKVDNQYVLNDDPTYADETFYVKEMVPNKIAVQDYYQLLKGVSINGTDLTVADNKVDIPVASASSLGVIKVGDNLTIDSDGTLNAAGGGTTYTAGTGINIDQNNAINVTNPLPSVTSADENKILMVNGSGEWVATTISAWSGGSF